MARAGRTNLGERRWLSAEDGHLAVPPPGDEWLFRLRACHHDRVGVVLGLRRREVSAALIGRRWRVPSPEGQPSSRDGGAHAVLLDRLKDLHALGRAPADPTALVLDPQRAVWDLEAVSRQYDLGLSDRHSTVHQPSA
jgi:hypothetical protein